MNAIIYREDGLIISLVNVKRIDYAKRGLITINYGDNGTLEYLAKYIRQIKVMED